MSSFRKSQYVEDSLSDGSFEELYKHIDDVYDILKRETNKLRKEKEAFDEVAKKLDHVYFSKMLKLRPWLKIQEMPLLLRLLQSDVC